MNSFVEGLKEEYNWKFTENGAHSLKSTNDYLVDLFGTIGSLRTRSVEDICRKFYDAFSEDKLLAMKMLFYARNIRGGLGERRTPRIMMKYLAFNYPDIMRKNLEVIPAFGRYDDLYEFVGTPIEKDMWDFMSKTFKSDVQNMIDNKPVSLLAKWMKSVNTSSAESNRLGRLTAKNLGLDYNKYRKTLSKLRAYIDVTEVKMSSKNWGNINYPAVPSRAMNIYRGAFKKNDETRFSDFIESIKSGESKINASTLYPYDIIEKIMGNIYNNKVDDILEEQWKNLPNYVEENSNVLIMADTSGSMYGRPMATSVGLAIYFAERNKGAYNNLFMTFNSKPELIQVRGSNLCEKVCNVMSAPWGTSTNLESAFNLVLKVAIDNNISSEDMPKSIVVISDMEIDICSDVHRWTFYDSMRKRFEDNGYNIPSIVFWNVNSRNDTFHTKSAYKGVQLASGQSASVFKSIVKNSELNPYEAMVEVLSDQVYDVVTV